MFLKEVADIKVQNYKIKEPKLHHGKGLIKCRHLAIAKMVYDKMVYGVSTGPKSHKRFKSFTCSFPLRFFSQKTFSYGLQENSAFIYTDKERKIRGCSLSLRRLACFSFIWLIMLYHWQNILYIFSWKQNG